MTTYYEANFEGVTFSQEMMADAQFECCVFKNCVLRDLQFKNLVFEGCEFFSCDLTGSKINTTALRDVVFQECKLIGLNFEALNPFRLKLKFESCLMDYASFYKLSLKNTEFLNCSLKSVDFSEADLSKTDFSGSNLNEAVFQDTKLLDANFRTSSGYQIDPVVNALKGAKFSSNGLSGLLVSFGIKIE